MISIWAWWIMTTWASPYPAMVEGFVFGTDHAASAYEYSVDERPWQPVLLSRCRPRTNLPQPEQPFECYVTLPKLYLGIDREFRLRAVDRPLIISNVNPTRLVNSFDDPVDLKTEMDKPPCDRPITDENGNPYTDRTCQYYWPEPTDALPPPALNNPLVL